MKRIAIIAVIIMSMFATLSAENGKNITVKVTNISEVKGQISIGLYNSAKNFPKSDKAYKGGYVKVNGKTASYTFKNIPEGKYAIALFHDVNNNKKMDKNMFGIPKEGYAFSNNVFGIMKAPDYSKCVFVVGKKDVSLKIKLKN